MPGKSSPACWKNRLSSHDTTACHAAGETWDKRTSTCRWQSSETSHNILQINHKTPVRYRPILDSTYSTRQLGKDAAFLVIQDNGLWIWWCSSWQLHIVQQLDPLAKRIAIQSTQESPPVCNRCTGQAELTHQACKALSRRTAA